jgi:hypothetical protein
MGGWFKSPSDTTLGHATQRRLRGSSVEADGSGTKIRGVTRWGSAYRRLGVARFVGRGRCYVRFGRHRSKRAQVGRAPASLGRYWRASDAVRLWPAISHARLRQVAGSSSSGRSRRGWRGRKTCGPLATAGASPSSRGQRAPSEAVIHVHETGNKLARSRLPRRRAGGGCRALLSRSRGRRDWGGSGPIPHV